MGTINFYSIVQKCGNYSSYFSGDFDTLIKELGYCGIGEGSLDTLDNFTVRNFEGVIENERLKTILKEYFELLRRLEKVKALLTGNYGV